MAAVPTVLGRAAGPHQRAARPAPAAPPTSPGRKGPEPPLRSRRRPGQPPENTPRTPCRPCSAAQKSVPLPPRPGRPAPADRSPPAPVLWPLPGFRPRADHTGLRSARLPERALRPAARRAAGAGSAPNGGYPLLQSVRGETPSKTELTRWSGGWEAGPYAL